jgi:hypothetical protein
MALLPPPGRGPLAKIGFATFPPLTYSPVKNDVESAIRNVAAGASAACAITGEVRALL